MASGRVYRIDWQLPLFFPGQHPLSASCTVYRWVYTHLYLPPLNECGSARKQSYSFCVAILQHKANLLRMPPLRKWINWTSLALGIYGQTIIGTFTVKEGVHIKMNSVNNFALLEITFLKWFRSQHLIFKHVSMFFQAMSLLFCWKVTINYNQ